MNTHAKKIEESYNQISNEFNSSRFRIWNTVNIFLNSNLDKKRLLDAGIGNGKNSLFAIQKNYNVIGIDISENLLNICRDKNIEVYKKNILNLSKKDFGLFDKIICIATIHHLENIEEQQICISNLIDCLKKSGKLLISVWSYEVFNDNEKQKLDYRKFNLGPNIIKWKMKNEKCIDRFYFIHNYDTFNKMFLQLSKQIPFNYTIKWEKQNWFCEITKLS